MNRIELKIRKLVPEAVLPKYATPGSAGMDLTAVSVTALHRHCVQYGTGLALEIPVGYVGLLFPRSSIYKSSMVLSNCVGVIDSDYRGEVKAVFRESPSEKSSSYTAGDRIIQLVLVPIPGVDILEVQELSDTERGVGGYGSTGK